MFYYYIHQNSVDDIYIIRKKRNTSRIPIKSSRCYIKVVMNITYRILRNIYLFTQKEYMNYFLGKPFPKVYQKDMKMKEKALMKVYNEKEQEVWLDYETGLLYTDLRTPIGIAKKNREKQVIYDIIDNRVHIYFQHFFMYSEKEGP